MKKSILLFSCVCLLLSLGAPFTATAADQLYLIVIGKNLRPHYQASESLEKQLVQSGVDKNSIEKYSLREQGINGLKKYKSEDLAVVFLVGKSAAKEALLPKGELYTQYKDVMKVFLLLTDPVKNKLVESWDAPGNNVTGVTMNVSPISQIRKLKAMLPGYDKFGIIHSVRTSGLVENYQKAAPVAGVSLITEVVNSPTDVPRAFTKMKDGHKVDILIWIEDHIVLASENRSFLTQNADEFPIQIGLTKSHVAKNKCLTAISVKYEDQGVQAANLYLKTKMAGTTQQPVEEPDQVSIFWNETTANVLGIKLPSGIKVTKVK